MLSAAERLRADLGEAPASEGVRVKATKTNTDTTIFSVANDADTRRVLDALGLARTDTKRGEKVTCPGCGNGPDDGNDGALVSDHGIKCLHATCAHVGPAGKPGFRGNVDIVMATNGCSNVEAAKWICQQLVCEQPVGDDEPPPTDDWIPLDESAPDAPPAEVDAAPCWQVLDVGQIFGPLPPMVYLVEALDLCAGAPGLWAGGGYSAKTVAAQSAAVAIATGQSVWGSFAARQGRVLHLDYEQGERLTRERYQRIAAAMLVTPHDIGDRLALVSMPTVYLDQLTAEPRLMDLLRGFDVAFIDSLRAACPNLEENDSGARVVLDMLNRVSNATGCVVIVIHHARKPSKEAPGGSRASIRGSGAIFDACGSVLVFDGPKGEPVRVTHEKARNSGRTVDDFEITVSDVDIDGNPRAGLQVVASALAPSTTEPSEAQRQLMDRLVEALRTEGPAASKTALANRVAGKREAKFAGIDQLVLDGRIAADGKVHRLGGES